jgi:hypothetical protein
MVSFGIWPPVQGWFGVVSPCAIFLTLQIRSKRIGREWTLFRFKG